jgi:hypothetical protein
MNRDEIIKLAREAGLETGVNLSGVTLVGAPAAGVPSGITIAHITIEELGRFAELVAAKERAGILHLSEAQFFKTQADYDDAIRARGKE